MIVHVTKKLAAHLPDVASELSAVTDPLGSWHANVYLIDKRHCVMFCHDDTRYVLFAAGLTKADFSALGDLHRALFLSVLSQEGASEAQMQVADVLLGEPIFDRSTDASVLGTLKIARQDLDGWLDEIPNVMALDPIDLSVRLNGRPVTARKSRLWPAKEMHKLLTSLVATTGRLSNAGMNEPRH